MFQDIFRFIYYLLCTGGLVICISLLSILMLIHSIVCLLYAKKSLPPLDPTIIIHSPTSKLTLGTVVGVRGRQPPFPRTQLATSPRPTCSILSAGAETLRASLGRKRCL